MVMYRWIIGHNEIISLCLDFTALIVSVVLTVFIYKLERRHEKEHEEAEEKSQMTAMVETAKVFLIDNDEEVDYLPLAQIAADLKLKRKHCRCITTRFLRCPEMQQREILRQANVENIHISMDEAQNALDKLQADLETFNFGRKILYDGAKYLHRAFERWAEIRVDDVNPYIFEDPERSEWYDLHEDTPWRILECKFSLYSYMWSYLHADEHGLRQEQITPPVDMVFRQCNLECCDEQIMTFWTMRIIIDACQIFGKSQVDVFDECLIETQEDMYYYTLATLCSAYPKKGDVVNDKD